MPAENPPTPAVLTAFDALALAPADGEQAAQLARVRSDEHVAAVDALRGFFALAVAVYHFAGWSQVFEKGGAASCSVAVLGIYAVEGFFVISGFCFFHLYAGTRFDARALRRFHAKRFLRIAPLYYFALALSFAIGRAVGRHSLARILENLTLSFGLFQPNHAMVVGGWSIGIEYVFYMVFPLLAWWLRRPAVLYAVTLASIALAYAWAQPAWPVDSLWASFNRYVELPNHAFLFLVGGVIADLRGRTSFRAPAWLIPLALLPVVLLAAHFQESFQDHFDVMRGNARGAYLAASVFLVTLLAFCELGSAGLAARALRGLGDISYSVYLLHPFASLAIGALLAPQTAPGLAFGLALMLTLIFATLARRWIERPALALRSRLAT
jgi:peptidoglycan/LPS O-acetylase OafA/YrhL